MESSNFTSNSRNTSGQGVIQVVSECFVDDPTAIKICRAFAYCFLILGSVVGNSLVIAVVRRDKNTKQTVGYFMQNMAVADLLITAVYMPRMIALNFRGYEWLMDGTTGLVLCKIVPFCHHMAIFVSIQTLVVISVERFLAVVYPLKRNITKGQAKLLIVLTWIGSVAVRIPRLLALKTQRKSATGKLFCITAFSSSFSNESAKRIYYEFLFYVFYVVPVLTIFLLYSVIVVTLMRRKVPGNRVSREEKRREIMNRKVFRMLFTVTCLFVLCWLMYFIVQILPGRFICSVNFVRLLLAHANSALTPCVYFAFSANYRRRARELFSCCNRGDSNRDTEISFTNETFKISNLSMGINTTTNEPVLTVWKELKL